MYIRTMVPDLDLATSLATLHPAEWWQLFYKGTKIAFQVKAVTKPCDELYHLQTRVRGAVHSLRCASQPIKVDEIHQLPLLRSWTVVLERHMKSVRPMNTRR